jgi:hypothetical protein
LAENGPLPDIETLRAKLASDRPTDNLFAIEGTVRLREAAAALIPDLVRFLTSERWVSCEQREYEFSGHAILAEDAMRAIEYIGVGPDLDDLSRLLDDRRIIIMPEACYDQGAYIGDYSSTTFSPAGLAAQLVPLHRESGLRLIGQLALNAREEPEDIGKPARRAIEQLAPFAKTADAADRDAYVAEIDRIAELPEALAPTTGRGFDLRDLARACRKVLAR